MRSLETQAAEETKPNLAHAVAADINTNNVLTKFTRYEAQVQASLYKAMQELEKLQNKRRSKYTLVQDED